MMKKDALSDLISGYPAAAVPPDSYQKKIVHEGGGCPLEATFSREQIERRVSFFRELNERRKLLAPEREVDPATAAIPDKELVEYRLALYGWEHTTTVRVYMRETVTKIAAQLFHPPYSVSVDNVNHLLANGEKDRDHGHVLVTVKATMAEIRALLEYIKPGSSYFVYDGERAKYVPGNTGDSEFIITKTDDAVQPAVFWRRSQSFVARIIEDRGAG